MGKKENKRERERLAAEQRAATQQLSTFIGQNTQPSPYQQLREQTLMDDLNYFNQATPDYSQGPRGMPFADAASREAQAQRHAERQGTGLLQMGAQGSNPDLVANLREQRSNRFGENAALARTDALNMRRAEATGSVIPMIGARNQGIGTIKDGL